MWSWMPDFKSAENRKRAAIAGSFSLVALAAVYYLNKRSSKEDESQYKPIPVVTKSEIGFWDFLNGRWREKFIPIMDQNFQEMGSIFEAGSFIKTVYISDPALIKDIARQPHSFGPSFADHLEAFMPGSLQHRDERLWAKRRKALVHGLRACTLQALAPCFIEVFNKAIVDGEIKPNTNMDFHLMLKSLVFASFGRVSFGRDVELDKFPESFQTWNNEFIARLVLRYPFLYKFPCPRYWRYLDADKYMRSRVDEVRNSTFDSDCVLSRVFEWCESQEEDMRLDEEEIFSLILIIFLAGYDTTANASGFMLYLLGSNLEKQEELYRQLVENGLPSPSEEMTPEALESVVRKCKYLDYVTNEALRHYPVGLGTGREAMEDVNVGPYRIKKGTSVLGSTWTLRYDEAIWGTDIPPREFVPERWAELDRELVTRSSFFPFGVGARDCPGQRLATLELKITAVLFLHQFALGKVEGKEAIPYLSNVITSKDGFWLNLQKRV